jgi:uncharacterized protein YqfB (UPF0267 family)
MVAYSFQQQFIEPILSGRKNGTIRANGKRRHARPGEELQLYVGMRTKSCRLVANSQCQGVEPIRILFSKDGHHDTIRIRKATIRGYALDAFAMTDGFGSWVEMRAFWREHHPGVDLFEGVWVRWACLSGGMLI